MIQWVLCLLRLLLQAQIKPQFGFINVFVDI